MESPSEFWGSTRCRGARQRSRSITGGLHRTWIRPATWPARRTTIASRYYGLRDFTVLDPDGFGLRFAGRIVSPDLMQDAQPAT